MQKKCSIIPTLPFAWTHFILRSLLSVRSASQKANTVRPENLSSSVIQCDHFNNKYPVPTVLKLWLLLCKASLEWNNLFGNNRTTLVPKTLPLRQTTKKANLNQQDQDCIWNVSSNWLCEFLFPFDICTEVLGWTRISQIFYSQPFLPWMGNWELGLTTDVHRDELIHCHHLATEWKRYEVQLQISQD